MTAARSPLFEAGGKRRRAPAGAEAREAAHPQERQHSAAEGGTRDRVRPTPSRRPSAQPSIDRAQVREIAGTRFIINSEAVLVLGPPGVGKTRIWRSPSAVRRSSPATRCCFHAGDHADRLIARIIFLEGFPNLQVLDPLRIGQTVEEILRCDLDTETAARGLYTEAAEYCISAHDLVSKELYDDLLIDEEQHIDFLETQLELIKQLGIQLYSQRHIGGLGDCK